MRDDPRHHEPPLPAWLGTVRRRLSGWVEPDADPERGTAWVVAVSGGSDSVGLLRVLHRLAGEFDLRLTVANLDHGTREGASGEDARFVAALADSLGLPFEGGVWSSSRAGHFEADAREARYAWLAEVARSRGASAVAVGHTRDDQAETILHRIVRGTGPRGLAGIPARRPLAPGVALVRPLLGVSRREIHDELARIGQAYREDATNRDVSQTRARIRHDLIPRLEADYNPKVIDALVRLGDLAAANGSVLDALVASTETAIVREAGPDRIAIDRLALAALDPFLAVEVLRRAWRSAGWPEGEMTARRWRRLARGLARGGAEPHVGAGVALRTEGDAATLDRSPRLAPAPTAAPIALEAPGTVQVPWADARFEVQIVHDASGWDEVVDLDRVTFPLVVRTPMRGESFDPLGMGGRRQRLVDFLRIRRVPSERRQAVPVVADPHGIIWVVGHRIAERVKTTTETATRLGLRWSRGEPQP